jgi:hypothetical protein
MSEEKGKNGAKRSERDESALASNGEEECWGSFLHEERRNLGPGWER